MKRRTRRGFSSFSALMVLLAFGILVSTSLRARTRDLSFEDRTFCRVRARWAAESAIAQGRAGLPSGGSLTGRLEEGVSYRLSAERASDGTLALEATGRCEARHTVEVQIVAKLAERGRRVLYWSEGSADQPLR